MKSDSTFLYLGDCVEVMRAWPENSVDAVVCDPPYGLEFMGKEWDGFGEGVAQQKWHEAWAREALRVLKPGGHLIAFGGSRTYHRLACALEDAGFEIRDCLMWLYGSGFPKSKNVALSIDKGEGHPNRGRAIPTASTHLPTGKYADEKLTANVVGPYSAKSEAGKPWAGWGTALKPAHEPAVLARKPLEGTVAANVQKWGVGALNIDGCRISTAGEEFRAPQSSPKARQGVVGSDLGFSGNDDEKFKAAQRASIERTAALGRWPANLILDEEAGAALDAQSGVSKSTGGKGPASMGGLGKKGIYGKAANDRLGQNGGGLGDTGGASRFFYCPKVSKGERDGSTHPTMKPIALMQYLVRLVAPKGSVVLDPFMGSGSTGIAARREGCIFVGIEREAEYFAISQRRISEGESDAA